MQNTWMLKSSDKLLLEALKASLENKKVNWEMEISNEEWIQLFQKADMHQILPLVYEAVCDCESHVFASVRKEVRQQVMVQMLKTETFLALYKHLNDEGIYPLLVKGIVCRNLYPNPDYRSSGDEDMLIKPEGFAACHKAMLDFGMVVSKEGEEVLDEFEVPYGKKGSPISIELHKLFFPHDEDVYGELNDFFENAHESAVSVKVRDVEIKTLGYTDHLFYLICHAFKHFLHSGFGIRQVCDIIMFANAYGDRIEWEEMLWKCQKMHAEKFAAAIFKIGEKYLVFDPVKAKYPVSWQELNVDEQALLKDLLDSGVYGASDMSRKHSSTITLNAVKAQKEGKIAKANILKTIFPDLNNMKKAYGYLNKYPFLLPVAWGTRIIRYGKESRNMKGNKASESIRIGNERVELLRQYGIIDK